MTPREKGTRAHVIYTLDEALSSLRAHLDTLDGSNAGLIGVEPALRELAQRFESATAPSAHVLLMPLHIPQGYSFLDAREAVLAELWGSERNAWIVRTIPCQGKLPALLMAAKQFGFEILVSETPADERR